MGSAFFQVANSEACKQRVFGTLPKLPMKKQHLQLDSSRPCKSGRLSFFVEIPKINMRDRTKTTATFVLTTYRPETMLQLESYKNRSGRSTTLRDDPQVILCCFPSSLGHTGKNACAINGNIDLVFLECKLEDVPSTTSSHARRHCPLSILRVAGSARASSVRDGVVIARRSDANCTCPMLAGYTKPMCRFLSLVAEEHPNIELSTLAWTCGCEASPQGQPARQQKHCHISSPVIFYSRSSSALAGAIPTHGVPGWGGLPPHGSSFRTRPGTPSMFSRMETDLEAASTSKNAIQEPAAVPVVISRYQ